MPDDALAARHDEVATGAQRLLEALDGLELLEAAAHHGCVVHALAHLGQQVLGSGRRWWSSLGRSRQRQGAQCSHQRGFFCPGDDAHGATPSRCHSTGGQTKHMARVCMSTATWMVWALLTFWPVAASLIR